MTTFLPWQFLLIALAGILNWQQGQVIEYLKEEIRVLRELFGPMGLQLNDQQRRRLAVKAKALGRQDLGGIDGWADQNSAIHGFGKVATEGVVTNEQILT